MKEKLKILFRTAGGQATKRELGFGHIYRCLNLASQLRNNQLFFLLEDYGGARKIFLKRGYKNITSLRADIDFKTDIEKTTKFIVDNQIDILIIDRYNVRKEFLQKMKNITKTVLITDLHNTNLPADLLVNGFIGLKNSIKENRYKTRCLLGPKFQILNERFARQINRKRSYKILATFGGFDEGNVIETLAEQLLKLTERLRVKVILGPGTRRSYKISELKKVYEDDLKVISQTTDMFKEISNVEFGICSGGITSYEFASQNVPFAIICQVKHQLETAREWEKIGIATNLGLVGNNTDRKIENFFKEIIKGKTSCHRLRSSPVDGLGSRRIAKEIMNLCRY